MSTIIAFIVGLVIACIYLAPALVAKNRKHNNTLAIFALNLFFGWTLLGWFAALIWGLTDNIDNTYTQAIGK